MSDFLDQWLSAVFGSEKAELGGGGNLARADIPPGSSARRLAADEHKMMLFLRDSKLFGSSRLAL